MYIDSDDVGTTQTVSGFCVSQAKQARKGCSTAVGDGVGLRRALAQCHTHPHHTTLPSERPLCLQEHKTSTSSSPSSLQRRCKRADLAVVAGSLLIWRACGHAPPLNSPPAHHPHHACAHPPGSTGAAYFPINQIESRDIGRSRGNGWAYLNNRNF